MTLALIAGIGRLPELLATAGDPPPLVFSLEGQVPQLGVPVETFRLERLGSLIADLKARGVRQICFAGAIRRPQIDPALIDAATMPLAPRIAAALTTGDDGALRAAMSFFEEAGLSVVGADVLRPDLLPAPGVPTRAQPAGHHDTDAGRAATVAEALGAADVGQACVVSAGQVLAVEALPGTDAMLATLEDRSPRLPAGGILYKAPKPGQDRRVDLPTIGPGTVQKAAAAGLEGLVIVSGGVLVLDAEATIAQADAEGLFIWIR